jgi:hypothetical protein
MRLPCAAQDMPRPIGSAHSPDRVCSATSRMSVRELQPGRIPAQPGNKTDGLASLDVLAASPRDMMDTTIAATHWEPDAPEREPAARTALVATHAPEGVSATSLSRPAGDSLSPITVEQISGSEGVRGSSPLAPLPRRTPPIGVVAAEQEAADVAVEAVLSGTRACLYQDVRASAWHVGGEQELGDEAFVPVTVTLIDQVLRVRRSAASSVKVNPRRAEIWCGSGIATPASRQRRCS